MSAFLAINGIEVPVLIDAGAKHQPKEFGDDDERAEDETLLSDRRAVKELYTFTVAHQVPATALAFRDLILGLGHYWSFDSHLYSSKGLGPSASTNATQGAGTGALGAGKVSLTASTGTITFIPLVPGAPAAWTVIFARKVGAGSYDHYIAVSTAVNYKNGASLGGSVPGLTVNTTAGSVKLDADAASTTLVDELVVLPFAIPADWAAQIYTAFASNQQWSQLRDLFATGDFIDNSAFNGGKTVRGRVNSMALAPAVIGGTFYPHVQTLEVELEEV